MLGKLAKVESKKPRSIRGLFLRSSLVLLQDFHHLDQHDEYEADQQRHDGHVERPAKVNSNGFGAFVFGEGEDLFLDEKE